MEREIREKTDVYKTVSGTKKNREKSNGTLCHRVLHKMEIPMGA